MFYGIAIGIIFVNNSSEEQSREIYNYVNGLRENLKESDNINKTVILVQSIKQNAIFVIVIWLAGCTLLGSFCIYFVILYKGFALGYTFSAILAVLGVRNRCDFFVFSTGVTEFNFFTNDIFIVDYRN